MDAVIIILTFIAEMEVIDAFVEETFRKHAVTHDKLVMDDVIILTFVAEMEVIDAFYNTYFC